MIRCCCRWRCCCWECVRAVCISTATWLLYLFLCRLHPTLFYLLNDKIWIYWSILPQRVNGCVRVNFVFFHSVLCLKRPNLILSRKYPKMCWWAHVMQPTQFTVGVRMMAHRYTFIVMALNSHWLRTVEFWNFWGLGGIFQLKIFFLNRNKKEKKKKEN